MYSSALKVFAAIVLLMAISACSIIGPSDTVNTSAGDAGYKIGKPYQINGNWYYPGEDYSYDETGIASWYGSDFHNKKTASGEVFDKNELTAAHKTLPMPSLVRVTNLDNGRSIVLRVNDRGPFSQGRVIDVSQRAAQLLGFERQGTAKVRVSILPEESRALAEAAKAGRTVDIASAQYSGMQGGYVPQSYNGAGSSVVNRSELPALPASYRTADAGAGETVPPTVPGRVDGKRFLPDPVVRQLEANADRNIWIQAGAFTVPENAEKLKGRLAGIGSSTITPITVNGVQYHRVRLGPIQSVDQADKVLQRVMTAGANGARIVID